LPIFSFFFLSSYAYAWMQLLTLSPTLSELFHLFLYDPLKIISVFYRVPFSN
jgi:hypothetical protein